MSPGRVAFRLRDIDDAIDQIAQLLDGKTAADVAYLRANWPRRTELRDFCIPDIDNGRRRGASR